MKHLASGVELKDLQKQRKNSCGMNGRSKMLASLASVSQRTRGADSITKPPSSFDGSLSCVAWGAIWGVATGGKGGRI